MWKLVKQVKSGQINDDIKGDFWRFHDFMFFVLTECFLKLF